MIQLDRYEKQWILLCEGHLVEKYPYAGKWHKTLKPLFAEIYMWNPDEDSNYHCYLNGMFNVLLDLFLKITENNWSIENGELKNIFEATFYKGITHDSELPIERAIDSLCGLIQNNRVIDNKDGSKRYDLDPYL